MTKEAMKLACKALRGCHYYMINAGLPNQSLLNEAFTAYMELEAALAEQPAQQQEPVTRRIDMTELQELKLAYAECSRQRNELLNKLKSQTQRTWVNATTWRGLTNEQIWLEYQARWPFHPAEEPRLAADLVTFARAIEAAHGIKENT